MKKPRDEAAYAFTGMPTKAALFEVYKELENRLTSAFEARDSEWRRLVEEAQASLEAMTGLAERNGRTAGVMEGANEDLRIVIDRLKGELATERESHREASKDAHHWEEVATNLREENMSLKGELAEVIAHRNRLLDDAAEDASELAEARRLLRTVASDASPAMDAWDAECDAFLAAATPTEKAQPTDADKRWCSIPSFCPQGGYHGAPWGICALRAQPAEQAQVEGAQMWPTIHGLEQHYREVRGKVAELAKRVEVLEEWARRQVAEPWFDPERRPAPPPPEAAGPGHAWRCAAGGSSCVVDGCRCADCDVPKNVHAVPPITGRGK